MATKIVTGNPVIIYDAKDGSPVAFTGVKEIVQPGSGNASGTNIRPIETFANDIVTVTITDGSSSNNYNILLNSAGDGVCQGTLDLLTGEITITHRVLTLTGTEIWSKYNSTSYEFTYYISGIHFKDYVGNIYLASAAEYASDKLSICSHARIYQNVATTIKWRFSIGLTSNNNPLLYFTPTPDITSVDLWKTYLAEQYQAGTPVQITYPLAVPETYTLIAPSISLFNGYNNISSNLDDLTLEYTEKTFNVNVPQLFTASPSNPYADDRVTLTYSGDIEPQTVVATGVDTMTNIPLTKTGDKTWSFTMPFEDVDITVDYKPYVNIELIQTTGGTVIADKTIAYEGDTVTITMTPDENYEPQSVKVTKDARDVTTAKVNDTTYTFVVHVQ